MRSFIRDFFKLLKVYHRGLIVFCIIAFLVSIVLGFAGFELSSHSSFCNTCHYMKPYVAAWKTSKHNHVPCAKCHYPNDFKGLMRVKLVAFATTIRYFTNTYDNVPKAEIEDANCLQAGCHEKRLLSGPVTYKRNIKFDHRDHLKQLRRGKQLKCTTCHSQIVQGKHITVTESVCFICHFKGAVPGEGVADCTLCHGAPKVEVKHKGFSFSHEKYLKAGVACQDCHTQVIRGDGDVPKQRCITCHMEPSKEHYDSTFIHNIHVTEHKVECFECHNQIEHGKIAFVNSLESNCDVCHSDLHNLQKEMFIGIGAKDVEDCPDPMFTAQVGCDACHRNGRDKNVSLPPEALASKDQSPMDTIHDSSSTCPEEEKPDAKASSCAVCHGKGYDTMLINWQWAFENYIEKIRSLYEKAKSALSIAPPNKAAVGNDDSETLGKDSKLEEAKKLFDTASYNYNFVKKGRGVHNVLYAKKILLKVQEDLNKSLALLSDDYEFDDVLGITEKDILPGCSQRCHVGVERIETVKCSSTSGDNIKYDVTLPHAEHVNKPNLNCTDCHYESQEPSQPKHGNIKISKLGTQGGTFEGSICFRCHYGQGGTDCNQCHHVQNAVLLGKATKDVTFNLLPPGSPTVNITQPSPHTNRVECKVCHTSVKHVIKHDEDKDSEADAQARRNEIKKVCDKCHTKGTGNMMIRLWQKQIKEPYNQVASSLNKLQGKLALLTKDKTLPHSDMKKIIDLSNSAKENLELIKKDGSWGVHNFELIRSLLTRASKSVIECNRLISKITKPHNIEKSLK